MSEDKWVVIEDLVDFEVTEPDGSKTHLERGTVAVGLFDDWYEAERYMTWSKLAQGEFLAQIGAMALLPIPKGFLMKSTHPDHLFRHSCCRTCWRETRGDDQPIVVPDEEMVVCCFCGLPTDDGIWIRQSGVEPMVCLVDE